MKEIKNEREWQSDPGKGGVVRKRNGHNARQFFPFSTCLTDLQKDEFECLNLQEGMFVSFSHFEC